jgi:hypothetical protein
MLKIVREIECRKDVWRDSNLSSGADDGTPSGAE